MFCDLSNYPLPVDLDCFIFMVFVFPSALATASIVMLNILVHRCLYYPLQKVEIQRYFQLHLKRR